MSRQLFFWYFTKLLNVLICLAFISKQNFIIIIMNYTKEEQIQQMNNWIERVVIGYNFCPFAKREMLQKTIHYAVSTASDMEGYMMELIEELKRLDENDAIETTLILFPNHFDDFETYLDLVDIGQVLLEEHEYEGVYQLASFHPKYRFEGTTDEDPANYTNRSPYPALHLLRESSIEAALEHYLNPELIPERNIELTRKEGLALWQQILKDCYKV